MSSLKGHRDVVLAPRARQDFIDILRYTAETIFRIHTSPIWSALT